MQISLPRMREIEVSPDNLILDPNNPRLRLVAGDDEEVPEEKAGDPGIVERTRKRISGEKDEFKLRELQDSILANGWQPVDGIFVKAHVTRGNYLVLEGNRRVMAIRSLLEGKKLDSSLRQALQRIKVMEVLDDASPDEQKRKISYLLGVRHHGSLQQWSPFAQAHNIYLHYLMRAGQSRDAFSWQEAIGKEIASALSVKPRDVKERLRVFRAMQQLADRPEIRRGEPKGGMKDSYYSICRGALVGNDGLDELIRQDSVTFFFDEESCVRMEELCHFSQPRRAGAPLSSPPEWTYLGRILADEDLEKRKENLSKVLEHKKQPSTVWAIRAEELSKLQWDKWLTKVSLLLQKVELGAEFGDDAQSAIARLGAVLSELERRDRA